MKPWNKGLKTGLVPKNAFKKGLVPWNKGKKTGIVPKSVFKLGHVPKHKGEVIFKNCLVCGGRFTDNPARMKMKSVKFCSSECYGKSKQGKRLSSKHKEKIRQAGKRIFSDKEYREKRLELMLKALLKRPTSLEKKMMDIIQKHHLPYKYTGDGSFWIGNPPKNPDFVNINGEKKLIEIGNVFHHQNNYAEKRKEHYANYGWKSYIFIQDRINREKEQKIVSFLS